MAIDWGFKYLKIDSRHPAYNTTIFFFFSCKTPWKQFPAHGLLTIGYITKHGNSFFFFSEPGKLGYKMILKILFSWSLDMISTGRDLKMEWGTWTDDCFLSNKSHMFPLKHETIRNCSPIFFFPPVQWFIQ